MNSRRKVDELGRIVLPQDLREHLNIAGGDEIEIVLDGDGIWLTKYKETCFVCDIDNDVQQVHRAYLCVYCREKL